MPEKVKPKGKGKGLNKKLGPFPMYYWLAGGAILVIGYIYYRRRKTASGIAGSLDQQTIPSGVVVPPQTGSTDTVVPSGTSTQDGGGGNFQLPSDYVTTTDFLN